MPECPHCGMCTEAPVEGKKMSIEQLIQAITLKITEINANYVGEYAVHFGNCRIETLEWVLGLMK